jgi:hypothetical protein
VVYSLYDEHVALLIDQAVNHLAHRRRRGEPVAQSPS